MDNVYLHAVLHTGLVLTINSVEHKISLYQAVQLMLMDLAHHAQPCSVERQKWDSRLSILLITTSLSVKEGEWVRHCLPVATVYIANIKTHFSRPRPLWISPCGGRKSFFIIIIIVIIIIILL